MKTNIKPAQSLITSDCAPEICHFSIAQDAFTQVQFNQLEPYMKSVAHQKRYAIASVRAQLVLGWLYTQKALSYTTLKKQFYLLKAQSYLSDVALQNVYPQGQQCAIKLLQLLDTH